MVEKEWVEAVKKGSISQSLVIMKWGFTSTFFKKAANKKAYNQAKAEYRVNIALAVASEFKFNYSAQKAAIDKMKLFDNVFELPIPSAKTVDEVRENVEAITSAYSANLISEDGYAGIMRSIQMSIDLIKLGEMSDRLEQIEEMLEKQGFINN